MTEDGLFRIVSTARFRLISVVLYLQLVVCVFRITYCPGATVLSSADTGFAEVISDGLSIVLLWRLLTYRS